jgi:hypothetical protein
MVWKLTDRITDSVPAWVPLLTAAASLWLFHSKDANVVNLLTHRQAERVGVLEFYGRALDSAQLPMRELRPDVALVEEAPAFRPFMARFPEQTRTCREKRFSCYSVPGM